MVAWVDREALKRTLADRRGGVLVALARQAVAQGRGVRPRAEGGAIRLDCDGDVVVLEVEQVGGIACHTGRATCFFRRLVDGRWVETEPVLKDPQEIYDK